MAGGEFEHKKVVQLIISLINELREALDDPDTPDHSNFDLII